MRRLAWHAARILIVVLLGGFLGATLVRLAPGIGVDEEELDTRLSGESIRALRHERASQPGLGTFYLQYLARLIHGDFGISQTLRQPVRQLLAQRLPETLKSVGLGLALGWTLGLAVAIIAVMSRNWCVDLVAGFTASILLCIPAAVFAILFVIARAPGRLVIGCIVFPKIFRYARSLLARSASLPHVITARAKGLDGVRTFLWHILPVSAGPFLGLAGASVSLALAAAIPVEVLCDLPGIGQLAWKAALGRDLELLVMLTMIVTLVTLVANSASDMVRQSTGTGEA